MSKQLRITDAEFELLKSTFADQEDLLKNIRNLFLGLPMTDDEKKQIEGLFSKNESLRKMMRKQFLPEIQSELPIGQAIDLWMTLDLKEKAPEQINFMVITRKQLIDMMEQALKRLEDVESEAVDLNEWAKVDELPTFMGSALIARNTFISHVDQQLAVIRTLSGMKTESVEETKKRLLQDSSK